MIGIWMTSMQHYIEAENLLANLFVDEWSNFTEEWITDNFGKHL